MTKRYSILVRENGDGEHELCQVDTNPEAVREGALAKTKRIAVGHRRIDVPRYSSARVRDNCI